MPQTISSHILHGFKDICLQHGQDYQALLEAAGLPLDVDPFSNCYLPTDKVCNLLVLLKQASQCDHISIELARHSNVNAFGAFGQLMMSADTLGAAWNTERYYGDIHSRNFAWTTSSFPPYLQLSFKMLITLPSSTNEVTEHSVAQMFGVLRNITGNRWLPTAICFRHAEPADIKPYRNYFRVPLRFDEDFDGMWMRAKDFDIPLPGANPVLHATLCQYAETLLGENEEGSIVQRIKSQIKHNLASGNHQLPITANRLGLSPRNLQRKLKQQGYKYETLVAEARLELSCFYLKSGNLPITRIADYVGYKNVSTFSTAFKQGTGLTPREWRGQHR